MLQLLAMAHIALGDVRDFRQPSHRLDEVSVREERVKVICTEAAPSSLISEERIVA